MSTARIEEYFQKGFIKPAISTVNPGSLAGGVSKHDILKAVSSEFAKNDETADGVPFVLAYYNDEMSFSEVVSPVKMLSPFRWVNAAADLGSLTVAKLVSDTTNAPVYNHGKATGLRRGATVFFALPFNLIKIGVAPIAALDTIPKCI